LEFLYGTRASSLSDTLPTEIYLNVLPCLLDSGHAATAFTRELSYSGIAMSNPRTLLELLNAAPPGRSAIVLPEARIHVTYRDLIEQVMAMADALTALGIRRGDRVATVLPNGLAAIVSFLAASIAGTAAPLNPDYREEEFRFYFEDTAARVVLCPPDGAEEARKAAEGRVPVHSVEMYERGFVRIAGISGKGHSAEAPTPDEVALVLHTSGSTRRPQLVPLRHRNLTASTRNIATTYGLSRTDVALCAMPLFHVHGLVASTLSTFLAGGNVVVPAKFNPLSFWRGARDSHVSWYSAVPTIHQLLLSRAGDERPAGAQGLRFIRSCSAALTPDTMRKMEQVFGAPVIEAYGMTEAAHQMCSNPLPPGERKAGSVGQGTGVRVSIMDDEGNHLDRGERGEVVIQGPNVITGYDNNPEANAKSFTKGWFRTGDQGYLDEDGYLSITGRIKELINRAGEKIAPGEIDDVLMMHPAVAEAVAFGVSHPTWGEEVAAAVVLRQPQKKSEILAFCRERLADFKCPKKLYIVETIPRTATGKIQRGAVALAMVGADK
jgi:acyl-CoA synthetase (AMP-forming)/AMP-acid ligase II